MTLSSFIYLLPILSAWVRLGSCILVSNGTDLTHIGTKTAVRATSTVLASTTSAEQCWKQWNAYSTASAQCPQTTVNESPATYTATITSVIYETYKLCDGHPRAIVTGGERPSTSLGKSNGSTYTTYLDTFPPSGVALSTIAETITTTTTYLNTTCASPAPTPQCTIDNANCQLLHSAWAAGGYHELEPPCTYGQPQDPCDNCQIYIPSVKLLYFPVTMTGGFCGSYLTVTPTSDAEFSTPTTVEVSGTTFTSGYAYLSYAGVTALAYAHGSATQCGTPKPAGILPIPSEQVSSYRGHDAAMALEGDIQWPFNFADLAPNPIPWDAWISQETCVQQPYYPQCQTITQAAYRPGIVYPHAFWSLESKWSRCASGQFGIVDPPSALPTAQEIAMPTTPNMKSKPTTSASPKMDPTETLLRPTSAPLTTAHGTEHPEKGSATSADSGAGRQTGATDQQVTPTTTNRHVPISALRRSSVVVGTLPVLPASHDGAVSVGANVLSHGEATTIGNTVLSLASHTLVISVHPTATAIHSDPHNALSVLAAAHTAGQPHVEVTLGGDIYTAYSGGMVADGSTTFTLSQHAATTVGGRTVSLASNGVLIDTSSFKFHSASHIMKTAASGPDPSFTKTGKQTIVATYKQGAFQTTLRGHLNPAGHTIMTLGSSTFTYSGQQVVEDGTTFVADIPSNWRVGATSATSLRHGQLPTIVSLHDTTASLHTQPPDPSNQPFISATATTTTSNGHIAMSQWPISVIFVAVAMLHFAMK